MSEGYRNASASSSSSLNSSFQDTEDDQTIASILAEEENLHKDGRLAKRLSHLDSIPHTPRVNGEIPDVNDATLDHERLSERLATYGLAELQIEGDGNCQFRALADQLFRNPDYHKHVRRQIVKQVRFMLLHKCRHFLLPCFLWYQLQFGAKICLVTSFRDTCYIEIMPKETSPTREVWLSFWSEVHYNSLYASGDVPTRAPRKKHWLF
ncbi:PREDICTED: OTU domain-containing protein DDB_G0284757 [Theobroma cacao]|uniref:OTU domain-containing protein DDB_G0284757 n=1 Tax=Theobroma cacao TaxID=3641 RepID=A0AB32VYD8_THECC|nr:PREDICTED: OTU domain-containing protein DDB_G0284757 [Theobroma cacao]